MEVKIGAKVLVNLVDDEKDISQVVGTVVWHDGSVEGERPWVVSWALVGVWDFSFFNSDRAKVLDYYESVESAVKANREVYESTRKRYEGSFELLEGFLKEDFGKTHSELVGTR